LDKRQRGEVLRPCFSDGLEARLNQENQGSPRTQAKSPFARIALTWLRLVFTKLLATSAIHS
jgi:hypothetical protein